MHWDIFCKVIDNYGDIGVCWRLAAELAARGEQVRLWTDDASALAWMAPEGCAGVQVLPWAAQAAQAAKIAPADVVIEAFGCELPPEFVAGMARQSARGKGSVWINLEYLSAESYVERMHALPSPVLSGPGAGLMKHFFYPGFTPRTGGLLREQDLEARQRAFDAAHQAAWLARHGVPPTANARTVSLFCYEPTALRALLDGLAGAQETTRLLVTAGRAREALRALLGLATAQPGQTVWHENVAITWLPHLTQRDYDHLLWACDLNFVRGEDSLVRAIWAGKPFVWQIYPQQDDAHHAKLEAFLARIDAPESLRSFHRTWNGLAPGPLPALDIEGWTPAARAVARDLAALPDLALQLRRFALEKR